MSAEQTTETAQPAAAGIEQAPAPCFYPEDQDSGHPFEWGDGTPHWTTASEAHRMMFVIRRDDRGVEIRLRRETEPCWYLACAECGYRYDEEEWCCHFTSRAEAETIAVDCDWHVVDGRLLCPECSLTAEEPSGCDCTSLCAMGPTCPGGMLAGLPDAGCVRTPPGEPT